MKGRAPGRVLVVDDNPLNRQLAEAMLRRAGCEVAVAPDAGGALALLASRPVDVVLTDIAMPGVDGCALLSRLRADPRHRRLRVVAYTALAMEHERAAILDAGFDAIVIKPVTREALLRAVHGEPPA